MARSYKISVTAVRKRGVKRWRVRWRDASGIHRAWYGGEKAAQARAVELRGAVLNMDEEWALLPVVDRQRLLAAWREAKAKGLDLLSVVTNQVRKLDGNSVALSAGIEEMIKVKRTSGRDEGYLCTLRSNCLKFAQGREAVRFDLVSPADVEGFLDAHGIRYRSTLRSRLSTLFKFGMRRGWRTDNPCAMLETVTVPYISPKVFSVDQVAACLKYLKKNPTLMGWFVLGTFAGLRPEEAQKTSWREIDFTEGWIKVEAQTSKIRERRVVYPNMKAMELLKLAKKLGARLPLKLGALKRGRAHLLKLLALEAWPKDITRHTAASYWLAETGDIKLVAAALAHSEKTLRKHYLALVTKAEAEKFWRLSRIND